MGPDYLERIKKLKSEKHITNEELSAQTGIPLGTLSKLLAGISDSVKLSNIVALCAAFDVSIDYIVSGTPENTNNFSLSGSEIRLIEDYRRLDTYGKDLVSVVISKERERISGTEYSASDVAGPGRSPAIITAPIANRYAGTDASKQPRRSILLYDLPVSAGTGEFLDGSAAEKINIPNNSGTEKADFALRISGNSMEPKYHSGDVLLVEKTDFVEVGELGVFILDGCGYFKQYGGDCLISLNPEFGRIMLKDFSEISCAGHVIGRLKKK